MTILFVTSNDVSAFSKNSNAFQQPLNLCRNFACLVAIARPFTLPDEIAANAVGVIQYDARKLQLVTGRVAKKIRLEIDRTSGSRVGLIITDHSESALLIGFFLSKAWAVPVASIVWDLPFSNRYEVRRGLYYRLESRLRLFLYRALMEKFLCSYFFINTGFTTLLDYGFREIVQLKNGVDVEFFEKYSLQDSAKMPYSLCYIGRLRKDKGAIQMLLAFEIIATKFVDARLYLFGDIDGTSDDQAEIEKVIKKHKHVDRIQLYGRRSLSEIVSVVQRCEIGLHPYGPSDYLYWNHVLKVGEYQILGVVPVAVHYPGISDIVQHNVDGILIEDNTPDTIASAVIALFGNSRRLKTLQKASRSSAFRRSWRHVTWLMAEDLKMRLGMNQSLTHCK